ncbi:MAG: response regulator, partial [Oscillospiraceae bacterium]
GKYVFEAADGIEAVRVYKENNPTIVFMDIIMPKKTGIEALTEIFEYDKKAKVVMASSVGTQNHLKDAINAGAYEFLQKPIENNHVMKILTNIIKEG